MAGIEEKLDALIAQQGNLQENIGLLTATLVNMPENLAKALSNSQEKKKDDKVEDNNTEEVESVDNIPCQG